MTKTCCKNGRRKTDQKIYEAKQGGKRERKPRKTRNKVRKAHKVRGKKGEDTRKMCKDIENGNNYGGELPEAQLHITVIVYFLFCYVFTFLKALFLHIILVGCSKLFQNLYIFVSSLFWNCKTRNEVYRDELKVESIEMTTQREQLRWLENVTRMGKERLARKIYEARVRKKEKKKADKNVERREKCMR